MVLGTSMDAFIFGKINDFALENYWLDTLGIFFAEYLVYVLVFLLFLLLIWNFKKYWLMVTLAFTAGAVARAFTELIRFLWARPRPFVENHVSLLIDNLNSAAFPSGHAAFFFGISTVLYFYNKKIGALFFVASFLISLGRVFCGIHWPLDILGGFLVGILSAITVIKTFERLKK